MDNKRIAKELLSVARELESSMTKEDEADYKKYQKNFVKFTKELERLSKKYGISLNVVGGVDYGKIKHIKYDADLSSGDLHGEVDWDE